MSLIQNKRLFYVKSSDRVSGTDSDFTYQFDIHGQDYDTVCLLQVSIPKSYYLIQSGQNTFTLKEGSSTATVTLPIGNYTRASLQKAVQTALNAASPNTYTYAVTVPSTTTTGDTGFYTFTVSGNSGVQPQFIFATYCYLPLGFNKNSTNSFVGNTLSSTNCCNLQGYDVVYINSDICSNGIDNVLQETYGVEDPNFGNIVWICPSLEAYSKPIATKDHTVFRFFLSDENDNPILLNGQSYAFTLMFYKKETLYTRLSNFIKYLALSG